MYYNTHYPLLIMKKMRNTKLLVAFVITTFITWMVMATLVYFGTDYSFKDSAFNIPMIFFMIIFGWFPGFVVLQDLDRKY